ncbi:nuclease A inhibitor family protein [Spirosoma luteum]|uniref:nuclease A inhibitor family protein n=1 Tax=Spirosoma luteum TaxID=431553 RepID=UPI00037836FA|nr:nuclease A inhibitor family protein [Spirosoma luteum]
MTNEDPKSSNSTTDSESAPITAVHNEDQQNSNSTPELNQFAEKAAPLLPDLLYPSESDEPLELTTCYLKQAEPLTVSHIKDWQMLPPSVYVEEIPEADFWEPVTTQQEWYEEAEKIRAAKFQQLKYVVEQALTVRQVFRVGETEMDVYLLGRQESGDRAGLKTKVVQT